MTKKSCQEIQSSPISISRKQDIDAIEAFFSGCLMDALAIVVWVFETQVAEPKRRKTFIIEHVIFHR
jgi:hypothetical protein